MANSDAYLIGKAKYKDHDEKKSGQYEELFTEMHHQTIIMQKRDIY